MNWFNVQSLATTLTWGNGGPFTSKYLGFNQSSNNFWPRLQIPFWISHMFLMIWRQQKDSSTIQHPYTWSTSSWKLTEETVSITAQRSLHFAIIATCVTIDRCSHTESVFRLEFSNQSATFCNMYNCQNICWSCLRKWLSICLFKDSIVGRTLASSLLDFAVKNCHHNNRAVLKNNLQIIKTLTKVWKSRLDIPYKYVLNGLILSLTYSVFILLFSVTICFLLFIIFNLSVFVISDVLLPMAHLFWDQHLMLP